MKERKIMSFDIADSQANAGVAQPIADNPIPEAMAEANKAIADFEAKVQEKAFAATVLSVAMSRTFRRDWLETSEGLVQPTSNDLQRQIGGAVQWLDLREIGLQPDFKPQRCQEAIETILQAFHLPKRQRILFSVSSDGAKVSVRLGIQKLDDRTDIGKAAATAAEFAASCWPGLSLVASGEQKKPDNKPLQAFANEKDNGASIREYGAEIRVVTGLPGIRKVGQTPVPATIDKLAAALPGRKWEYLVIADPVSNEEMDASVRVCREFAGRAESVKSFQFGRSVSSSFSTSFSKNWGRNESRSNPTLDWKSAGVELAAAATLAVLCPQLLPAAGAIFFGLGKNGGRGGIPGQNIAASILFSKLVGNKSAGQSYGENVSESVSASKSANIGETITNKHAEAVAKFMDAQAERYERAKALGGWDVGTYFIGENAETANLGANVLKAVLAGDDSSQEPVRIHAFQSPDGGSVFKKDADPMEALLRFENPNTLLALDGQPVHPSHPLGERFDALRTVLNTRELTHLVNFPLMNLPGVPVRRIPADTGLGDIREEATGPGERRIGFGRQMFRGKPLETAKFSLSPSLLAKHALVCGINGSGKTNTILGILGALLDEIGAPFLVIEPAKQEYVEWAIARNKKLVESFGEEKARKRKDWIRVYIPGREKWKGQKLDTFQLNPFDFVWLDPEENPKTLEHLDRLKTVINAAMPMQEILPVLMEELLYMSYGHVRSGDNKIGEARPAWLPKTGQRFPWFDERITLPSFQELKRNVPHLFRTRTYAKDVQLNLSAALETRIESFTRGWRHEMLNKEIPRHSRADWEALFERPTVVNLTSLASDEDKAFFMAVLLLFIYEYRQECSELPDLPKPPPQAGKLRHLLVVEEAHRVLGKADPASSFSANPKQKVSEMFSNMISEVRAYGQGILVADQIPSRLNEDAIKNTNLKIVHKLVSADDRAAMATALNLWDDQERTIGDLGVGEALVRGDMDKQAIMVKINKNV